MAFICACCREPLSAKDDTSLAPCGHVGHRICWLRLPIYKISYRLCRVCSHYIPYPWNFTVVRLEEGPSVEQHPNLLENCTTGTVKERVQNMSQNIRMLATSAMPPTFGFKQSISERISEVLKDFSDGCHGFEINVSVKQSYQQIFRLSLELSGENVSEGVGAMVPANEKSSFEMELQFKEPNKLGEKVKFVTDIN